MCLRNRSLATNPDLLNCLCKNVKARNCAVKTQLVAFCLFPDLVLITSKTRVWWPTALGFFGKHSTIGSSLEVGEEIILLLKLKHFSYSIVNFFVHQLHWIKLNHTDKCSFVFRFFFYHMISIIHSLTMTKIASVKWVVSRGDNRCIITIYS